MNSKRHPARIDACRILQAGINNHYFEFCHRPKRRKKINMVLLLFVSNRDKVFLEVVSSQYDYNPQSHRLEQ